MKRSLLENYLKDPQQLKIQVSALGNEKDNRIILFSSYLILIIVNRLDISYFIFEVILYWNNFSYRIQHPA